MGLKFWGVEPRQRRKVQEIGDIREVDTWGVRDGEVDGAACRAGEDVCGAERISASIA